MPSETERDRVGYAILIGCTAVVLVLVLLFLNLSVLVVMMLLR